MKDFYPIIECCDGENEFISPEGYAKSHPDDYVNVEYVKNKQIKRAYIIFYDNPSENEFLGKLKVIFKFHAGSTSTDVFEYKNSLIAIAHLGGPAAALLMEKLSVFGIKEFIAIGSAGCLDDNYKSDYILVEKAIRDEGTSYHYLKPSTYVQTDKSLTTELANYLDSIGFTYKKGITWTDDALYRETTDKVKMARELGAVAVELECASWAAVAKYRHLKFTQLLYFSDVFKQSGWSRLGKRIFGKGNPHKDLIVNMIKDMIDKNCSVH